MKKKTKKKEQKKPQQNEKSRPQKQRIVGINTFNTFRCHNPF